MNLKGETIAMYEAPSDRPMCKTKITTYQLGDSCRQLLNIGQGDLDR